MQSNEGSTPLMWQLSEGHYDSAARLLEDPRVRATVNVQDKKGNTAFHEVSSAGETPHEPVVAQLLEAGADPTLENDDGERPLYWFQDDFPTHPTTLALLEQSLSAEKASFLVKVRLVMAAHRTTAPSFLVGRVADGLPLPHVALASVTTNEQNAGEEEGEKDCKLRTNLAFMCGVEREAMPRDVFRVVLDLLMPSWDPLRKRRG